MSDEKKANLVKMMKPEEFIEYAHEQIAKAIDEGEAGSARLEALKSETARAADLLKQFESIEDTSTMQIAVFQEPGLTSTPKVEGEIDPTGISPTGSAGIAKLLEEAEATVKKLKAAAKQFPPKPEDEEEDEEKKKAKKADDSDPKSEEKKKAMPEDEEEDEEKKKKAKKADDSDAEPVAKRGEKFDWDEDLNPNEDADGEKFDWGDDPDFSEIDDADADAETE